MQSKPKAPIGVRIAGSLFTAHQWVKDMIQGGLLDSSPAVMNPKFHSSRCSDYHDLHWSIAHSVFEGIQNEVVQQLLQAVRVPIPACIANDLQFNPAVWMTYAQLFEGICE